jgi:Zn-dependent metalloprotease
MRIPEPRSFAADRLVPFMTETRPGGRSGRRLTPHCRCLNCIMPPHILRKLLESKDKNVREAALNTLLASTRLRGQRMTRAAFFSAAASANSRRTIFDLRNSTDLSSASTARTEDGPPSGDDTVNRAFDGLGTTRVFYHEIFDRNSVDDRGMRLEAYVHYDTDFNNAFWDGREMIFGDGDGVLFTDFTKSVDVIAHELTHGVTQFTAGLDYHNQSGALNESISDVFGSLVKQWSRKQTAEEADWLIGPDIFTPGIQGDAIRSMKAPGQAYNNELLGKDPQPDHMNRYVQLPDTDSSDHGGVHINSGIPNKAFYLTAAAVGGYAWEAPGRIWYESLKASNPSTEFQDFADTTYAKAGELFRPGGVEQQAVLAAWREVGIRVSAGPVAVAVGARRPGVRVAAGSLQEADKLAALTRQMDDLSGQMKVLVKEVGSLKATSRRPAA